MFELGSIKGDNEELLLDEKKKEIIVKRELKFGPGC